MLTLLLQLALTLSSGLVAGAGVTFTLVCVPQALACSNPLPSLKIFMTVGGVLAKINIMMSVALGMWLFFITGSYLYLLVCLVALGIVAYTFKYLWEVSKVLIYMEVEEGSKNPKMVKDTIESFGELQVGRSLMKVALLIVATWANLTSCQ